MKLLITLFMTIFMSNAHAEKNIMSYGLWNVDTGHLLISKDTEKIRGSASITKIMTVLVILRLNLDLDERVTVVGIEGSRKIRQGDRMTRHELINLALVASDNLAARTLSETSGVAYEEFIAKMNSTATAIGMSHTNYNDSTGLDKLNVSTPTDIKMLIQETEKYSVYKQNAMAPTTVVEVSSKNKTRQVTANNTNQFAGKLDLIGAKTGYTNPAGRCLTMFFQANEQRYILVVMGAKSNDQRYKMVTKLIDTIR